MGFTDRSESPVCFDFLPPKSIADRRREIHIFAQIPIAFSYNIYSISYRGKGGKFSFCSGFARDSLIQ
ncbi:hypothetical protein B5F37_14555 [Drancourtella sp. An210]|nr:hypothetical protein B5F37_14555 [Drancourtella sp. An210]